MSDYELLAKKDSQIADLERRLGEAVRQKWEMAAAHHERALLLAKILTRLTAIIERAKK